MKGMYKYVMKLILVLFQLAFMLNNICQCSIRFEFNRIILVLWTEINWILGWKKITLLELISMFNLVITCLLLITIFWYDIVCIWHLDQPEVWLHRFCFIDSDSNYLKNKHHPKLHPGGWQMTFWIARNKNKKK